MSDHASHVGHPSESRSVHVLAATAFGISAATALLIAALDASSVTSRLAGDHLGVRPMWFHCFSVAVISGVAAAAALRSDVPVPPTLGAACWAAAALNLTVPLLADHHGGTGGTLAALHVVTALLLASIAVVGRHADPGWLRRHRGAPAIRPGSTGRRPVD
jgi:hypothetical protein